MMSTPEPTEAQSPPLARPPAWQGLQAPSAAEMSLLEPQQAEPILARLKQAGRLYAIGSRELDNIGYLQFFPQDGSPPLFLKAIDRRRLRGQRCANRIAQWLHCHRIAVSRQLSLPRQLDAQRRLLSYPLIDGRFTRSDEPDLRRLGHLLGQTHRALQELPWSMQVAHRSRSRDRQLHAWYLEQKHAVCTPEAVRKLLHSGHPDLPHTQAQVLHGDLNFGNILFDRQTGQPHLLDFEDAVHNWHSPTVDLAMAVERFVLVPNAHKDPDQIEQQGRTLLEAYLQARNGVPLIVQTECHQILQSLAIRSLVLLGASASNASLVEERAKFIHLFHLAGRHAGALQALWSVLRSAR